MENLAPLFADLADSGGGAWVDILQRSADDILDPSRHGHMPMWQQTVQDLPAIPLTKAELNEPVVTFGSSHVTDTCQSLIREALQQFHPWRKGPFDLFGVQVDAEWRSDLKWERVAPHVNFSAASVLDIGCGNGYYGWRMLGAGANRVMGLEPYPLYNMQHAIFKHYATDLPNHVIPAKDRVLEYFRNAAPREQSLFDVVLSMGVFYHSKDPIGHLESIRRALRSGGTAVLETLVIDGDENSVLVPRDRYAKMRNVWLIPSTQMLERLLRRAGFREVDVVDVTRTTPNEQRRTDWMRFESLENFLDADSPRTTVEGYPAPTRAVLIAR